MRRAWMMTSAFALGIVASFASCATTTTTSDGPDKADGSVTLPPPDAAMTADADAEPSMLSCELAAWCSVSVPMSARGRLNAVWGTSKTDVWAVGSSGAILHYDGGAWTSTQSEHLETFFDVWGSSPTDVWVVSSMSLILHSTGFTNGAATWASSSIFANLSPNVEPNALWDSRVFAVWGSGSDDMRLGTEAVFMTVYAPDDSAFRYAGDVNQFMKTAGGDAGEPQWRVMPSKGKRVWSIWGSSATDVWMTIEDANNATYEGGVTIHGTPYTGGRPNPAALEGYACNGCVPGCTSCAVVDDPLVWTRVDSQSQVPLESVWGSSAGDVWAVGQRGTIRRIQTGDARWQIVPSPTTETLHHVWGSGPNDVWMVGDNGTILHFDGTTIAPSTAQFPSGPLPSLRGVWGSGPDDVWIVGDTIALHYTGPKKDAP
jgi:hypothetical protein